MRSYSNLPEEITIDILSRVPAKSVGRCRCVSKSWRALLTRSDFIRTHLHLNINLQHESLLFISYKEFGLPNCLSYAYFSNAHRLFEEITVSAEKPRFAGDPSSCTRIVGSCHGLLLLANWDDEIFVLNPITRELREVPIWPYAPCPSESCSEYGFGYDAVSDDYKIVTITFCDDTDDTDHKDELDDDTNHKDELDDDANQGDEPDHIEMFVNIYSLKTGTWKRAESPLKPDAVLCLHSGVFVHGCIHWVAWRTEVFKAVVVAFDLVQEKFHEVPPPSSNGTFVNLRLGFLAVLGGCLCIFKRRETDIWVMEEYGVEQSWTKFTIDDPEIAEIWPLCMWGQDGLVLRKGPTKLVVYSLKERILKDVDVHGFQCNFRSEASFVESLVSPHETG